MCFMLAYHAQFAWAKGAFFALSKFFTLSGFLITAILLRKHERGGIQLRSFWVRRYRRLLPASLLTQHSLSSSLCRDSIATIFVALIMKPHTLGLACAPQQ
jgi:peptidoglycan/LPS O-acetylase OafA/YrhL